MMEVGEMGSLVKRGGMSNFFTALSTWTIS